MTTNNNQITPLGGTGNPNRELDVLFVHGLGGDAYSTWRSSTNRSNFWPDWLVDDFPSIGVWTIGYGATPSRWLEDVMPMEDRALNLLNHLSVKKIGDRPIVFITHSMGGLITKHILDQARNSSDPVYKQIAANTRGIVFLAVPHNGSGWADMLDGARLLVRGNKIIEQLQKDDSGLRRLSNSFCQIVDKYSLECMSFFETKEIRVKKRIWGTKGIQIVSESSARGDFPQAPPIPLGDDHLSICKLDSRDDQLYGNVEKFIKDRIGSVTPKAPDDLPPPAPQKLQISKLPHTNSQLYGREDELALLDTGWQDNQTNILTLIAMGGTGKTALMKKWLDQMAVDQYRGATAVYTWSFYSQGSAENKQPSADEFFDQALRWFGYSGDPTPSAHDKGVQLANLINEQRALVILDGLEPMQYPMGGAMDGALRDEGLKTLCRQLAANNSGLLLISSRQPVMELDSKPLVIQHPLLPLTAEAGIELFRAARIKGTDKELADTVTRYNGHALSLNLLAKYLSEYEDSDIRQQDNLAGLTDFPEQTRDSLHADTVMAAYERQLHDSPDLQILFLLGLFDRPVSAGAIQHLRQAAIPQVSPTMDERIFKAAVQRLQNQDLLNAVNPEHPDTLDTHPLVREYFGKRLAVLYPESRQQAHQQLYAYYKGLPDREQPDTLSEMEPLFAAIAHGCAAGLQQEAMYEVYWPRIKREGEHYLTKKLGGFGADLSVLAHFFATPWHTPAPGLTDDEKAVVLSWAAFRLRALGRLQEAVQPMEAGRDLSIEQEDWKGAAEDASNLSELHLTIGAVDPALEAAEQSVQMADKSEDAFQRMAFGTTLADARHQAGEPAAARASFIEAEKLQQEDQPEYDQLYSLQGFQYCDLLLTNGEWLQVQQRAGQTLQWAEVQGTLLLDIALNKLSLGRASLQQAITQSGQQKKTAPDPDFASPKFDVPIAPDCTISSPPGNQDDADANADRDGADPTIEQILQTAKDWLDQAVAGLRAAGTEHYLPRGLLTRAALHRFELTLTNPSALLSTNGEHQAKQDLQETRDIAQRSGMRLFLTDFHLESCRLALTINQPVLDLSAAEHLTAAKKLIKETGYKRRLPEAAHLEERIF